VLSCSNMKIILFVCPGILHYCIVRRCRCRQVSRSLYIVHPSGAYPRFKNWGTNYGERDERGAEGVECEEEVSPGGQGCGEVAMPLPRIFF